MPSPHTETVPVRTLRGLRDALSPRGHTWSCELCSIPGDSPRVEMELRSANGGDVRVQLYPPNHSARVFRRTEHYALAYEPRAVQPSERDALVDWLARVMHDEIHRGVKRAGSFRAWLEALDVNSRGDDPSINPDSWEPLCAGVRPMIRAEVTADRAEATADWIRARGFAFEQHTPDAGRRTVFLISRDPALARAGLEVDVRSIELRHEPARRADVLAATLELGAMLGYPRCCVEAFVARQTRGVRTRDAGGEADEVFVAAESARARSAKVHGRLNHFCASVPYALIPFVPCTFDCTNALAVADAVMGSLESGAPRVARDVRAAVMRPVFISLDGTCRNDAPRDSATETLRLDFEVY